MYVDWEEAKEQIGRRWKDFALRRKVREYVGNVPEFLRQGPRAVLARHLPTPNFECFRFARGARSVALRPHCSEYAGDLFCSGNPDKRHLARMTFFNGRGRRGGNRTECHKVIDLGENDRQPFRRILTLWEEDFVDFHHRLLNHCLPQVERSDCSEWLREAGGPEHYWPRHLALYLCHGVLFDNFHSEGQERLFTRDIIRPAIDVLEKEFGLKPLVVPLVPVEQERDPFWSWYPGRLEPEVRSALAPTWKAGEIHARA